MKLIKHRKIRFSGWDTLLRPRDTKSYLLRGPDMRSYFMSRGHEAFAYLQYTATHADPDQDFPNCVGSAIIL
jgi:hypothetical protein